MMKYPQDKEKICKLQFQTENDFYLDGDELIMPVYPRHHRSNDKAHHDHDHDYDYDFEDFED